MTNQSKKQSLGLAGEFLVAGELLRREIVAAVTYGNSKKADVIAVSGQTAITIEVKTTSQQKWVVGNSLPENSPKIWCLVYLPEDERLSPVYFIMTGADLHKALLPFDKAYREKYIKKHGKEFSGKGVYSIQRKHIGEEFISAWDKVNKALGI